MIRNNVTSNVFTQVKDVSVFQNSVIKGYNASIYGDIYLSGYGYIVWTRIPEILTEKYNPMLGDFREISRTLYKAVQIPDVTLNVTEVVTGFGGTNKLSIPTTIDMDTNLSITYNELSGTPITRFHQAWISAIRDYASGVSDIPEYGLQTYTADLLYFTTKPVHYASQGSLGSSTGTVPNERIIETAHLFTHIFPTIDKQSNFSMNIETSDKIEVEVPYRFSQMFMGDAINKLAEEQLPLAIRLKDMDNYAIKNDTIDPSFP